MYRVSENMLLLWRGPHYHGLILIVLVEASSLERAVSRSIVVTWNFWQPLFISFDQEFFVCTVLNPHGWCNHVWACHSAYRTLFPVPLTKIRSVAQISPPLHDALHAEHVAAMRKNSKFPVPKARFINDDFLAYATGFILFQYLLFNEHFRTKLDVRLPHFKIVRR